MPVLEGIDRIINNNKKEKKKKRTISQRLITSSMRGGGVICGLTHMLQDPCKNVECGSPTH
jgi:hypothetical protein